MFQKRIIWQLYPSYLLITLLSLLAVTWYSTRALRTLYMDALAEDLENRARVLERRLLQDNIPLTIESCGPICQSMREILKCRITIILPNGKVIGESDENPQDMENHRRRPEIMQALQGVVGRDLRHSDTVDKNMMYIAVPVLDDHDETHVIVRTSLAASAINDILYGVYIQVLMGGLIAAAAAAVICLVISQRIIRPLQMLKEGADRIADGDLKVRLNAPGSEEMGHVATAMNKMVEQLDNRIQTINRQRQQQEAIFASMIEGVLAVDKNKRIITMNQAAAKLLHISIADTENKLISDIIDNPDIFLWIDKTLASEEPLEAEIVLEDKDKMFLQVHGAALRDSEGERIGAVIVMHDITTLRRLENIRRDFVANVSHELKTPITSIKGFVETLLDGAMNDHEDAMRFLGIISRQADRLHSIIEDLLSLSRIEQDKDKESIPLESCSILPLMENALECCKPRANEKNISLELVCEKEFFLHINPPLLEQAVVNLTDNAIKYSDSNTAVRVEISRSDKWAVIKVQDWGCGIEEEHLPRIFERFYRVDKARSRKLGGTGLGLAIVKHITQTHGGYVTVDSKLGQGSLFSIHLPLDAPIT